MKVGRKIKVLDFGQTGHAGIALNKPGKVAVTCIPIGWTMQRMIGGSRGAPKRSVKFSTGEFMDGRVAYYAPDASCTKGEDSRSPRSS